MRFYLACFVMVFFCASPEKAFATDPLLAMDFGNSPSDESGYPTPYILSSLGLNSLVGEQHRKVFTVKDEKRRLFPGLDAGELAASADKVLGLTLKDLAGKSVLSVGEGASGLVPYLRKHGVHAWGSDIAYPKEGEVPDDSIKDYFERHKAYLRYSDATRMREFKDGTYDLVLSHMVYHNIPMKLRPDFLSEIFRVTKRGGAAHIAIPLYKTFYGDPPQAKFDAMVLKRIRAALELARIPEKDCEMIALWGKTRIKITPAYAEKKQIPADSFEWLAPPDTSAFDTFDTLTLILKKK